MTWRIGPLSIVKMHYRIRLADGMEVVSNFGEEAFEYKMGSGALMRGLELALLGLRAGDKQSIRLPVHEAFGVADPNNRHYIERQKLTPIGMLRQGMIIDVAYQGDSTPATVLEIEADRVLLDFNHPLAGHDIDFDVEIVEVVEPEA